MSTRGVIAKVGEHEGEFSGVYHHWDSMPSSLGKTLVELLRGHFKNDLTKMLRVLTEEHCGWSTIVGKNFRLKPGYRNNYKAKNPACYCHGVCSEKVAPFTHKSLDKDTDVEWLYAFDVEHNTLAVRDVRHDAESLVDLSESKIDWATIECGENFERCGHYAWFHKLLPRTSNLSTQTWLGNRPLEFHDVVAVVVNGKRYAMTGSGGNSEFLSRTSGQRFPRNTWVSSVKRGSVRLDIAVAKVVEDGYQPLPGVVWVMPPTLVNPEETLVSA